ncbi:MAG: hypothetical protein AAF581_17165 [Planctomycetota bacterium]
MNLKQWRERLLEPLKELLSKLSPSQRLSLGILAVVISVGISLLVFTSPSDGAMVRVADAEQNPEIMNLIQQLEIPYELSDDGRTISVPQKRQAELRVVGAREMLENPGDRGLYKFLFDAPNWGQSSAQRRDQLMVVRKAELEQILAGTPHIERAQVVFNKPPSDDWTYRKNRRNATAAVMITPADPGVGIKQSQARIVGDMVSRGLGVPLVNVTVSDGIHRFDMADSSMMYEGDRIGREKAIEEKLRAHYNHYSPWEVRLTVNLQVTRDQERTEIVTYDQENSFSQQTHRMEESRETTTPISQDPGVGINVRDDDLNRGTGDVTGASYGEKYKREEEKLTPAISSTTREIIKPANQEKSANVWVSISSAAIAESLREERRQYQGEPAEGEPEYRPTKEDVQQYLKEQEQSIEALIAMSGTEGKATVTSFIYKPDELFTGPEETGFGAFLANHFRELILAALALIGCFLIYRIAVSAIPELEELPDPVADLSRFLEEREAIQAQMNVAEEATAATTEDEWALSEADQAHIEMMETVAEYTKDNPDVTAAVVKMWMKDSKSPTQLAVTEEE